jgi:hypothetical protein
MTVQVYAGEGINTEEMYLAHLYEPVKPLDNPVVALIPYDQFKRLAAVTQTAREMRKRSEGITVTLYRWHGRVLVYGARLIGHQFTMETGEIHQVDVQGKCHIPDFILRSDKPDDGSSI